MSDLYTYERIMRRIDPEVIAEKVSNKNWLARESFQLKSNKAKNYDELVAILTEYVQHHWSRTGLSEDFPEETAFGQAVQALQNQGLSIQHIYDNAIRGTGGGIRKILDTLAEQFEQEQVRNYIEHILAKEIDQQDHEQLEGLMTAYLRNFSKYLPYSLRSVPALMMNWKSVLLETSRAQSKLRSYIGKI